MSDRRQTTKQADEDSHPDNLGLTSVRYFVALIEMLKKRGVKPETLLTGTGLSPNDLKDINHYIAYAKIHKLLNNAIHLTNDPHLGFDLGQQFNLSSHGPLGYAALICPTPYESIQLAVEFFPLITALMKVEYHEQTDYPNEKISYIELLPAAYLDKATEDFVIETMISSFEVMTTFILGQPEEHTYIEVKATASTELQQRVSNSPLKIYFAKEKNRIVFPRRLLDRALPLTDGNAKNNAIEQCRQQLAQLQKRSSLAEKILQQLMQEGEHFSSLEDIAKQQHVSSRTLRRKLDAENTSYRQILDAARMRLAKKYLQQEKLPVTQVAFLLGYKDSANFSRSFKRITGQSPSQFVSQSTENSVL